MGAAGARACCSTPCPGFPLHHVRICLQLNQYTSASIDVGCLVSGTCVVADQQAEGVARIDYKWPATYTSTGRRCRVIQFDQEVPNGSFVRLRLCSDAFVCAAPCPDRSLASYIPNSLLKFEVDGVDQTTSIQALAEAGGWSATSCARSWCIGATISEAIDPESTDCCQYTIGEGPEVTWNADGNAVTDLPVGTEIVVGRIGYDV